MEELLKYVNEKIQIFDNKPKYTEGKNDEEIKCLDAKYIYYDGHIEGKISAYYDIKQKLNDYMNKQNK